jgi:hypothetical protein
LGAGLIGLAAVAALLLAAAARRPSLTSTLLLAYLAFFVNLGLVTLLLSPYREVTRGGLAAAELALCAGAAATWALRGRPGLPLRAARATAREALSDPVTALFLAAVVVLFAYEVLLAIGVPPNNSDALAYHLTKAAAWAQHGGIYWIPQAPTARLNTFQPLAEQQLLFLFVATGNGALYALPQLLAELAILVAIYGASRRLGFDVRAAACAALLFATFSLVALEGTTGQNDLVAASLPAAAACLLLGRGLLEPLLAGVAAGAAVGVKLTTAFVAPVLAWLAVARGRAMLAAAALGGAAGFLALGMWGYLLNDRYTGHVLGTGADGVQADRGSPGYPASVANAFYLAYLAMDASVLSSRLIHVLALVGVAAALVVVLVRRRTLSHAVPGAAGVATPFLAPLLVIGASGALAFVARRWGFPIRGADGIVGPLDQELSAEYTRISNEDYSAFGPVGIVSLLAATAAAVVAYAARRADVRHLALASTLPLVLVLVSLFSTWNPFLIRFFLVPAVLVAPLLARLVASRVVAAAYLVVAAITVGLTITQDQTKPLTSRGGYGRPWNLTQSEALFTNSRAEYGEALDAFDRLVPQDACVGAILSRYEPSYILFGPRLQHDVVFLDVTHPLLEQAVGDQLFYVVVSKAVDRWTEVGDLTRAGWRLEGLGPVWLLAVSPARGAATGRCSRGA